MKIDVSLYLKVKNILANYECGIGVAGFFDFKESDIIEVYEIKEVKRKLI